MRSWNELTWEGGRKALIDVLVAQGYLAYEGEGDWEGLYVTEAGERYVAAVEAALLDGTPLPTPLRAIAVEVSRVVEADGQEQVERMMQGINDALALFGVKVEYTIEPID